MFAKSPTRDKSAQSTLAVQSDAEKPSLKNSNKNQPPRENLPPRHTLTKHKNHVFHPLKFLQATASSRLASSRPAFIKQNHVIAGLDFSRIFAVSSRRASSPDFREYGIIFHSIAPFSANASHNPR